MRSCKEVGLLDKSTHMSMKITRGKKTTVGMEKKFLRQVLKHFIREVPKSSVFEVSSNRWCSPIVSFSKDILTEKRVNN